MVTLHFKTNQVILFAREIYHTPIFHIFYADSKYITFETIHWGKMEGRHFWGTMSQALPTIAVVTKGFKSFAVITAEINGRTWLMVP